ncbi:MAG: ABC transporter substrate-binding protein [Dehalococcoidales bacterium]|nr:ABC transporter substrate-binding protein [Dehalococcoidales bacterium]
MKRRFIWIALAGLMVLSLVIAACAPAVTEQPPVTEQPEVTEEPEVTEPTVEKPKYGGVLNVGLSRDIFDFDEIVGSSGSAFTLMLTNETVLFGDWTKGPAGGYGTNETPWYDTALSPDLKAGLLAESFELPTKMEGDTASIIYHIRQGVKYALDPENEASRLVGGREVTAEDVLNQMQLSITEPTAYIYKTTAPLRTAEVTSPAPWTIKVEVPWDAYEVAELRFGGYMHAFPKEPYEKWGTGAFADWRHSVGTGPWILKSWVPSSSATLVRNPDYWMTNPIGPGKGDQLPYMDGVKIFIIPDNSTLMAAMRTGKIDTLFYDKTTIDYEDGLILKKTMPEYMNLGPGLGSGAAPLMFKLDRPPFNDVRVRKAMFQAIDFDAINEGLFDGQGLIHSFPIAYPEDFAPAYLAPDDPEFPAEAKDMYNYDPEAAKQLLAEAGYPDGFKTNLIIGDDAKDIDYFSIYKDYWSKIGADVELRPKETGALENIQGRYDFDGMIRTKSMTRARYYFLSYLAFEGPNNQSQIEDPVITEGIQRVQEVRLFDIKEAGRRYREVLKYVYPQYWAIPVIAEPGWTFWPPWLKNYSGEWVVGAGRTKDFFRWVWIDTALKKELGY